MSNLTKEQIEEVKDLAVKEIWYDRYFLMGVGFLLWVVSCMWEKIFG